MARRSATSVVMNLFGGVMLFSFPSMWMDFSLALTTAQSANEIKEAMPIVYLLSNVVRVIGIIMATYAMWQLYDLTSNPNSSENYQETKQEQGSSTINDKKMVVQPFSLDIEINYKPKLAY